MRPQTLLPVAIIVALSLTPVSAVIVYPVEGSLQLSPAPVEGNLRGGGSIQVTAEIAYGGPPVVPGSPVPGSQGQTFTGNLQVETSVMFRRVGTIVTQSTSTGYNAYLNGTYRERAKSIPAPKEGEKATVTETFKLWTPTEIGVRPDENMLLMVRSTVSLEVAESNGTISEKPILLKTLSRTVQVYDVAKRDYLTQMIAYEENLLQNLDPLKAEGSYDNAPLWNKLIEIKTLLGNGNISEAGDRIQQYRRDFGSVVSTLTALVGENQRKAAEYDDLEKAYTALLEFSTRLTLEKDRIIVLLEDTANLLAKSQKDYEALRERYATLVPVAAGSALLIGILLGYTWGRRSRPLVL